MVAPANRGSKAPPCQPDLFFFARVRKKSECADDIQAGALKRRSHAIDDFVRHVVKSVRSGQWVEEGPVGFIQENELGGRVNGM